jgi:hypothetical protein
MEDGREAAEIIGEAMINAVAIITSALATEAGTREGVMRKLDALVERMGEPDDPTQEMIRLALARAASVLRLGYDGPAPSRPQ